jgi:uncharacterized membrane protein (UPF0127 family)
MVLKNATTGLVIADDVRVARDPISRLVGLLSRATVSPNEGLWLGNCGAVHTMGMRATIDLIFLDEGNRVLGTTPNAVPGRLAFAHRGAKTVVELGAGSRLDLVEPGHKLELEPAATP